MFHRIGGAPPQTFPNVKYDAPEEVGGNRKYFDSPIKKWGLVQILDVNSTLQCTVQPNCILLPLDGAAYILKCYISKIKPEVNNFFLQY